MPSVTGMLAFISFARHQTLSKIACLVAIFNTCRAVHFTSSSVAFLDACFSPTWARHIASCNITLLDAFIGIAFHSAPTSNTSLMAFLGIARHWSALPRYTLLLAFNWRIASQSAFGMIAILIACSMLGSITTAVELS